MIESKLITDEEEKALLQEWFETVDFVGETFDGIPALEPENDDEERSALMALDTDALLAELRLRDPDNPF